MTAVAVVPAETAEDPDAEQLARGAAHRRAAARESALIRLIFHPPLRLTTTEWADRFRILSPEFASKTEQGPYCSARAPYQREPMDCISDPAVRRVVLAWGGQLGKSTVVENAIGRNIHLNPGPMLMLRPRIEDAESWSKERLAPMVRDTPVLQRLVRNPRSRHSDNTIRIKHFPGGYLAMVGANAPAGVAARSIRDLLCDECDRFAASAGTEGDPIELGRIRLAAFGDAKEVLVSTPTVKGQSRIMKEFETTDQRYFYLPCPHCGHYQILAWGGQEMDFGLKWTAGDPGSVRYLCEHCHMYIDELAKSVMLARGEWCAMAPAWADPGFWLNSLYSPFDGARWPLLVKKFLEVKRDPLRFRTFVNTVWAETWEDYGASVNASALLDRLEDRPQGIVPHGAAVLFRAVDVQGDRLEMAVWAWGPTALNPEGWLIDWEVIPGSPGTPAPWRELDELLERVYAHESGAPMRPFGTFVDTGGSDTDAAYAYCRNRLAKRVFGIKGASAESAPLLGKPNKNNAGNVLLYPVGSSTGKENVLARLNKITEPGPGYLHLPGWVTPDQLRQFENEKLVTRPFKGRTKRVWEKTGPNEQLDLVVYCLAGLQTLSLRDLQRLPELAAQLSAYKPGVTAAAAPPTGRRIISPGLTL